jgi:4-amino-4-deoxy-L-arabinose transferase-like glycosyltransferase
MRMLRKLPPGASSWTNSTPEQRRLVWASMLTAVALLAFLGLSNRILSGYIEPYIGGIVRGMASTGDFIVPRLNGHPYLEKPPLYYVIAACCVRLFHSLEPWVMRLPSALLGLGTVIGVARLGRRLGSERGGIWAGWMLATSFLFFRVTHTLDMDAALTAFVTLAFGSVLLTLDGRERNTGAALWFPVALALAFLTKGPVGLAMVVLPLLVWAVARQDSGLLKQLFRPNWGWAVGTVLVVGWLAAFFDRGGWPYMTEAFLRNGVGRYWDDRALTPVTHIYGLHQHPIWFYLRDAPGNMLPWTLPWIFALLDPLVSKRALRLPIWFRFAAFAFLVDLVLLSLSFTKRGAYLLPLMPLTLLATGVWLDRNLEDGTQIRRTRVVLFGTFLLIALAAVGGAFAFSHMVHGKRLYPILFSALFLAAGFQCVRWVRGGHPAWAWHLALGQVTALLASVLVFVAPVLNQNDQVMAAPFRIAKRMEAGGFRVFEYRLGENDLGYASTILGHDIPSLDSQDQLPAELSQPGPLVVLVDPDAIREGAEDARLGTWVDLAEGKGKRLESRTAKLLSNQPMEALTGYLPQAGRP